MTLTTALFFFLGRKTNLQERLIIKESFNILNYANLTRFAFDVVKLTFIIEGIGTVLLFCYFYIKMPNLPVINIMGHAVFHAVSAFCNAGFSTFPSNLTQFVNIPFIQFVISSLFILGGLGFVTISDIYNTYVKKVSRHLTLHTKTVLVTTVLLIIFGTALICVLEWNNALKLLPGQLKVINAYFQAVTPRTAGFNTINLSSFTTATLLIVIFLMFIGASSGGTGGGVKTTTFSVVIAQFKALLTGKPDVLMFKRRVPEEQIFRAFLIIGLALTWLLTALVFMFIFNRSDINMETIVFELVSAFSTVGLSLGSRVNPTLSASYDFTALGKFIIIITMFLGRVGILTIITSLIKKRFINYTHPEGVILVG
jgi:trk system potassium uptake protein TrkH